MDSTTQQDRPHAIVIPQGWNPPAHVKGDTRQDQIFNFAEDLLGGKAWVRNLGGGEKKFITCDPEDSYLFADGHRLGKTPRYRWVKMPDGSELGFLKPEAQADLDLANETPDQRAAREAAATASREAYAAQVVRARRWLTLNEKGAARTPDEQVEFVALDTDLKAKAAL